MVNSNNIPERYEGLPAKVVGSDHVVVHEGEADDRVLPPTLLPANVAKNVMVFKLDGNSEYTAYACTLICNKICLPHLFTSTPLIEIPVSFAPAPRVLSVCEMK